MFEIIAAVIAIAANFINQGFINGRERLQQIFGSYEADKQYEADKTLAAYSIVQNREKQNTIIAAALAIGVLTIILLLVLGMGKEKK